MEYRRDSIAGYSQAKKSYNSKIICPEDVNQGTVVKRELSETDYQSEEDTDHEDEMDDANKGHGSKTKGSTKNDMTDDSVRKLVLDEKLPVKVFSVC